jgi:hypothetical protein
MAKTGEGISLVAPVWTGRFCPVDGELPEGVVTTTMPKTRGTRLRGRMGRELTGAGSRRWHKSGGGGGNLDGSADKQSLTAVFGS